jgi:polyphosphate kinase 1
MDFKFIDNANKLYKQKHYLKNRDLSILEFQLRLVDLLYLNDIPFMERINFIKIICNNLEEFISVRLPNVEPDKISQMIHTIESIYKKLGEFLNYVNDINEVHLEDYTKSLYKIISDKSFRYIYAGESSIEIADEIKDVIKIKNGIHTVDILYSNCNINSPIFKNKDVKHFIKIPMSIMILDDYIEYYSKISSEMDYYPKEKINVPEIDYFTHLQTKDMLIRNPYESYDYVVNFIDQMCKHSEIVAVFITLSRTAKDSKIIKSLLAAKLQGKDVYVYIEPTARDNEEDNLKNIELLNSAGIHVNCNYYNYKVHGKVFCAIGKNGKIFTHIGTGNYNEKTAKIYTDFHLLTTNQSITLEALKVMMSIFRKDIYKSFNNDLHLYSSPLNFRPTIIRLIKSEIKKGNNGYIRIKCNSICDCDVIDKLYQAASTGVKVQIISRTGCSVSIHENIEVRSKVGRYLEHDRFYIFGKDDDCKVYISSADLLLRNINKRLEILCEILEDENKEKILTTFEEIWNAKHIHILQENGKWRMR